MSEPKRTAYVPAFACLVVLLNFGWLPPFSPAAVTSQPPRPSLEDQQRAVEVERQRMNRPEGHNERLLLGDLGQAMGGYYRDKNAPSRSECESLLTKVLALPKPSARAYSTCAAAASLLDRPRQAIEIVKKAIAEYPEEHVEGPIVPLRISGYYRIGALATRIGDVNEATRAYEIIVINSKEEKGREFLAALSYVCLADLARRTPGREQQAAEKLRRAAQMMEGVPKDTSNHDSIDVANLIKGWAAYELAKIERGGATPDPAVDSTLKPSPGVLMLAVVWATVACPSLPELEQMNTLERPSVLRDLAGLAQTMNYLETSDLFKAEEGLARAAEGDSYFKVPAQAWLDHVREEIKQMHERIPALLNDLRHGTLDQQELAASQLAWHSGPEGIKVLQEAQEEADKRVRCIAACTLAAPLQDQSVKARFGPILEAFADDDPRIREMAKSAMVFSSRMEMGAKEWTDLLRLLNERYSQELLAAVEGCLLSFKGEPEVLGAAAPEVAKLINHENKEISETVLNTLNFMDVLPAQIAAGLAQRLDRERDNNPQLQIISILGRMGPAAKDAVPVLLKYARHDDPNIRYQATEALKQISPADATGIPKTADEP